MQQRKLPVKVVEVVDHDRVFQELKAGDVVNYDCTYEQVKTVQAQLHAKFGLRLRRRANMFGGEIVGYSLQIIGHVSPRK